MHDRPDVAELLDAVQRFLDEDIVPATTGRKQFLARVAANCVRMVDRELSLERDHFAQSWRGLDDLFGAESAPPDRADRGRAVSGPLELLCEPIRQGEFDEGSE